MLTLYFFLHTFRCVLYYQLNCWAVHAKSTQTLCMTEWKMTFLNENQNGVDQKQLLTSVKSTHGTLRKMAAALQDNVGSSWKSNDFPLWMNRGTKADSVVLHVFVLNRAGCKPLFLRLQRFFPMLSHMRENKGGTGKAKHLQGVKGREAGADVLSTTQLFKCQKLTADLLKHIRPSSNNWCFIRFILKALKIHVYHISKGVAVFTNLAADGFIAQTFRLMVLISLDG